MLHHRWTSYLYIYNIHLNSICVRHVRSLLKTVLICNTFWFYHATDRRPTVARRLKLQNQDCVFHLVFMQQHFESPKVVPFLVFVFFRQLRILVFSFITKGMELFLRRKQNSCWCLQNMITQRIQSTIVCILGDILP